MKKVLIVKKLGIFSLIFSLIFRLIHRSVYYYKIGKFLDRFLVRQLLARLSIKEIDFHACSYQNDIILTFGKKDDSTSQVTNNLFNIDIVSKFLPIFINVENPEEKIKACFQKFVATRCKDLSIITMWIQAYFDDESRKSNTFYLLDNVCTIKKNYLKNNSNLANIIPVTSSNFYFFIERAIILIKTSMIFLFRKIFSRKSNNKSGNLLNSNSRNININSFKVLFFPHKSIFFGDLFVKDHFYSDDKNSIFYQSNILHIELDQISFDKQQIKRYEERNINTVVLNKSNISDLFNNAIKVLKAIKLKLIMRLFINKDSVFFYFMYLQSVSFLEKKTILKEFSQAKIALIGYEMLFHPMMYLALESNNIKTVASQERFMASTFYENWPFMLDHYLCGSNFVCETINKSNVKFCNSCFPCGLVRTDFLFDIRKDIQKNNTNQFPEKDKLIVAFDFHSKLDRELNRIDPFLNWKSNNSFYLDLIKLAKRFPNVYIVIRGKNTNWTEIDFFQETVHEINLLPNIEINKDYNEPYLQYEMGMRADLIIAKHASIGEELISTNKPVLFYDFLPTMDKFMSTVSDYGMTDIFVYSFSELQKKVEDVLYNDCYLNKTDLDKLQKIINNGPADGNVKKRIQSYLENLYADTI